MRSLRLVPGIGITSFPCASTHASTSCAGVHFLSAAMASSRFTASADMALATSTKSTMPVEGTWIAPTDRRWGSRSRAASVGSTSTSMPLARPRAASDSSCWRWASSVATITTGNLTGGGTGILVKDNATSGTPAITFSGTTKTITTTGQVTLGAEPVRAKRADVWISGDSDVILFAKRNASWAAVVEPDKPIDKRPNTWACRYGDPEWKAFLDFFGDFLVVNGEMDRLFKLHMEKLGAA